MSSTKIWMFISGVLLVALLWMGGTLVLAPPTAEAKEPVNLAVYEPDRAPAKTDAAAVAPAAVEPAKAAPLEVAMLAADRADPVPISAGPRTYTGDVQANEKVPIAVEVIGQVLKLNVEVGDRVRAGDILLQIDSTTLEAQRAQALAGLLAAQAQLDQLLLEAEESDVEAARASISAATAAYDRALEGPTKEDLEIAESQVRQAEAGVSRAQAAYDRVSWNPAIAALPESQQLQQATLQLAAAQAQYEKIVQGTTADVISGANAQVVGAQAQLDRLLRGATQPQIDMVKAQIQQAETALYLTQIQVDKATVRAPIDGIVSRVNTAVGANVAPGAPVFDLLSNEVKVVIAVEELRLAEIEMGQPVTIRVNAYPDRTFEGEVAIIAPELNPSTRTAEVTIRPTGDATGLAPGMFATVELDN